MKLLCSIDENKDTVNKEYVDNANVASATKLQTARTIAIGTGAVGTATSFNGTVNITIPITTLYEAYAVWGGKSIAGDVTPDDMGCIDEFGHNKLAFLPAECVHAAYSTDGGTTWQDYGLTDSQKIALVSTSGPNVTAGKSTTATAENIANLRGRIRLACGTMAKSLKVYTATKKFLLNVNTGGAGNCKVKIRRRTIANYLAETETWTDVGTYTINGWSGWNSIPYTAGFGGSMTTQTSQVGEIEFEFWAETFNSSYASKLSVIDIRLIGSTNWSTPSEMARAGHLYNVDTEQSALFPGHILPKVNNSKNLGNSSYKWANVYATTFNGDLSGNATTATTATTATKANKLTVIDTRSTNDAPSTYWANGRQIVYEFKNTSTVGNPFSSGTYCAVETICPWDNNSGGLPVQLATSNSSTRPAFRVATNDNTWGSWNTLALLSDIPSSIGTVTSVTIQATGPIAIDSSAAITTSGTRTISHSNSGVTAGTYRSVTVNATGHVTAGTNPTTLSGYGITDAKIDNGVITLGSNTITPLTSFTETDPVFTASTAYNIDASDIEAWNAKQDILVSGENIKTINGFPITGSGNIVIGQGGAVLTDVEINNVSITGDGVANLSVDGVYNPSTNKLATQSTVRSAINAIDYITYAEESFTNPILNTTATVGVVTVGKNTNPIQLKMSNNIVKILLNNNDIVYIGADSLGKTRIYANNMNALQSITIGNFSWTKLSDGSIMFGGDE